MGPSLAVVLLPALLAQTPAAAGAGDPAVAADTADRPATDDRPAADAGREPSRLKLGPYGRPYSSPLEPTTAAGPRFESSVDVYGKAPPDPNLAMAVWWEHFNLPATAIYGRGIIYRQPLPNGGIDIVPLVEWLAKKVKERR